MGLVKSATPRRHNKIGWCCTRARGIPVA